jgi:multidrug efflux pump subunit AcrB
VNISEPFIRRPVATALMMAALAFAGLVSFPFLPVAPLPQVDFPTIQVTAGLPGGSPETMAAAVAAPLERQFGQVAGVTQMTVIDYDGPHALGSHAAGCSTDGTTQKPAGKLTWAQHIGGRGGQAL